MSDEQEELQEASGAVNADAIAEAFSDDSLHDDEEEHSHYHADIGDDEMDDSIDTNFEIMNHDKHW